MTATFTAPTQALSSIPASNPDALRFDAVPHELKAVRRWVTWRRFMRDGKWTKKPYQRVNRPNEWLTYDDAVAKARNPGVDGIGFVLGDGFIGIDLDHALEHKSETPVNGAEEIVADLLALGSYVEISPSGTGVHCILIAKLPAGVKKNYRPKDGTPAREIYDGSRGRFFTVTGDAHSKGPPTLARDGDTQRLLDAFIAKWIPVTVQNATHQTSTDDASPAHMLEDATAPAPQLSCEDILAMMFCEKRGGAKWQRVWSGRWDIDYASPSHADLGLVRKLRYYVGPNAAKIDELFRQSDLVRPKWDEKHGGSTYGEQTIAKAISLGGRIRTLTTRDARAIKREERESGILVCPFWWVTHAPRMGELHFRALLLLAGYADTDGKNCYPSQATMKEHLGLKSTGEVSGLMDDLEQKFGIIKKRWAEDGLHYDLVVKRTHVNVSRFGETRATSRGRWRGQKVHVDVTPALTSTSSIPVQLPDQVINTGSAGERSVKTKKPVFEEMS